MRSHKACRRTLVRDFNTCGRPNEIGIIVLERMSEPKPVPERCDEAHLRDRIALALDGGDLDAAGASLDELVAITHAGEADEASRLSIADLAQRLGDSRAERKLTSGAIAGYHLALQEL